MEGASVTTLETFALDVGVPGSEVVIDAPDDRCHRRSGVGAIPATRTLSVTMYTVLASVAATVVVGLLMHDGPVATAAFAVGAAGLAMTAAIGRAKTALTPAALRSGGFRSGRPVRVSVVGTAAATTELREALEKAGVGGVEVVREIDPDAAPASEGFSGLVEAVRRSVNDEAIDLLLIGSGVSPTRVIEAVMRSYSDAAVRLYKLSAFYEDVFGCVPIAETGGEWLQYVLDPRYRERRSQRILDVAVAAALLVLLLPLFVVLVLLIRSDGGPSLFRQRRIGRDGRPFIIYKFRTMRWVGTNGPACWTGDDDPRITSIGRVLRRRHLDELPQLANVLRGDMTLVGPRPEQPEIAARLDEALPLWRGRHRYRPGLTGWAQVRCGYGGSADGSARKLAHDLYYLRRHSLALDVAILAQTACMVLLPRWYREEEAAPLVLPPTPQDASPVWPCESRPDVRSPDQDEPAATRAVVTGGAGFIGSRLVERLIVGGYDVVAIDDLSSGREETLRQALAKGARLEIADCTVAAQMARIFADVQPDVVFHLAAQIEMSRAVADPLDDANANVLGTLAVLEAARVCGARRLVLASSGGATYGDAFEIPTHEYAELAPLSPDGAAKIIVEHYAALYARLYGLSTIALRLANVYGPGQSAVGDGGVVARFCRARVDGRPAAVYGDGLQTRDYVHVQDVAAAFVAAAASATRGALNIGSGSETTVLDLISELGLRADFRTARIGEVRRSCLDASAAARVLGWRPSVSLEDGLSETLAHTRDACRMRCSRVTSGG